MPLLAIVLLIATWASAMPVKNPNHSLIWQISGNGLTKKSYLFGTIHLICRNDFVWNKHMKKSFNASEKICFEMDLDDRQTMIDAAMGFIDTSGKLLSDYFSKEEYKIVKKFIKDSLDIDPVLLLKATPVALENQISMLSVGCANAIAYEDSLLYMAKKRKKEVWGLESAKEQIDVLTGLSNEDAAKEVLEDIKGLAANRAEYSMLVNTYKHQDIETLYTLIVKENAIDIAPLLDNRNAKWISRMDSMMAKNAVFFAVGAGHLWGEKGLITLLTQKGYTAEPVKE